MSKKEGAMARITIEIEDTTTTAQAGAFATRIQAAPPHPTADVSGMPAELAAKAAALGAHNAGPAPSLGGLPTAAAPVPFISSSASGAAHVESASAGAAPAHLFGPSQTLS